MACDHLLAREEVLSLRTGKQPARSRGSERGPGSGNPGFPLLPQVTQAGSVIIWIPNVGEVDTESHSGSGVGGL